METLSEPAKLLKNGQKWTICVNEEQIGAHVCGLSNGPCPDPDVLRRNWGVEKVWKAATTSHIPKGIYDKTEWYDSSVFA